MQICRLVRAFPAYINASRSPFEPEHETWYMCCDETSGETVQICRLVRAFPAYINASRSPFEPEHETWYTCLVWLSPLDLRIEKITGHQFNMCCDEGSGERYAGLLEPVSLPKCAKRNLSQDMRLGTCAVKKGSGKTVQMWRLVRAITAYRNVPRSPLSQNMRLGSCAVTKAQARMCKCEDLPEPSLLT